ncbi:MAG: DUF805 domain-containing protein [Paracoccaceae bacterium]|nr:DUF805 domain-containing protein [Paracoccaceae bacterium]
MIGPIAAIEAFFLRAFNFTGRASRAEYWWAILFFSIALIAAIAVDVMTVLQPQPPLHVLAYWTPILLLLTFIPQITVAARRLHDTGRSSLWYLVSFVPFVGPFILMFLLAMPGQTKDNKWGAPRGPEGRGLPMPSDDSAGRPASTAKSHDPMAGYAVLINGSVEPSQEQIAAQRAQISDYYRSRVLGKSKQAEA